MMPRVLSPLLPRRTVLIGGLSLVAERAFAAAGSGKVIGNWGLVNGRDLVAYSNGPDTGTGTGRLDYQCVALVRRYLKLLDPPLTFPPIGEARNLFPRAERREKRFEAFRAIPNGSREIPIPGDILCFNSQGVGHVAIVLEALDDSIEIIEQNWRRDTAIHQLSARKEDGRYTVLDRKGARETYTVQGWCRVRGNPYDKGTQKAQQPQTDKRRGRVTCLIVDCSESMREEERFRIVKQLIRRYVELQGSEDWCALVTFNTFGRPRFGFRRAQDVKPDLDDLLERLDPIGDTNIGAGLTAAMSRVGIGVTPHFILVSDGGANTGEYRDILQEYVERQWRVSTFVFGRRAKREVLRDIAVRTGGKFVDAGSTHPLAAFAALVQRIR